MDLLRTSIFLEETQETIELYLSLQDQERAGVDSNFLQELVNKYKHEQAREGLLQCGDVEEESPNSVANVENDGTSANLFIWTTSCVLLLLHLYEENVEDFDGVKRHKKIYEDIAKKMKEKNPQYDLTWAQCQTKMNGLKRTYKKIIDHNNTSGNDRASWPFFDRMHEIFGKTGWAKPKALASEAGPSPTMPEDQPPSPSTLTPKRRRINDELKDLLEKRFKEAKEEKQQRCEEREKRRKEKEDKKEERFLMLLELRRQQHEEKMKLMEMLLKKKFTIILVTFE